MVACTADANRNTAEGSLEALIVALQKLIAKKEEDTWRSAMEALNEAARLETSKGSAGGDQRT